MIWIFCATPNAPKSYTIQEMHTRILIRYNAWNEIDKSELKI